MSDWPLPPLYEPRGPRDSDEEVVRAFLRHQGPTPHSERLHVEDRVLRVDGDMPLALWMGPRSVLLLFDLTDALVEIRAAVASRAANTMPRRTSPRIAQPYPDCSAGGIGDHRPAVSSSRVMAREARKSRTPSALGLPSTYRS